MDPLHPILPERPSIPPVSAPPRVGRVDRDTKREEQEAERRKQQGRARPQPGPDDDAPHVDITA